MKGNLMPSPLRFSHVILSLAFLGPAIGCAQLDWKKPVAWVSGGKDEPQAPTKMVAVWADAVAEHPDRQTRGFGGRLTFFGPDRLHQKPTQVEGTLVVYAYDEESGGAKEMKPDRKYVFTSEQFATHYSESKLGDSYSIWIPWDEVGGPRKRIGLICRFQPAEGPPVVSEQTVLVLPGKEVPIVANVRKRSEQPEPFGSASMDVQPVAHLAAIPIDQAETQPETEKQPRIKTATISIPPHFGRRTPVAQSRSRAVPALMRARALEEKAGSPGQMPKTDEPATALPDSPPAGSPSTDSRLGGSPAATGPSAPPAYGRGPWQPRREGLPYHSRSTPRPATGSGASSTFPVVWPGSNS